MPGKNYIVKSTVFHLSTDVDDPEEAKQDFEAALTEGTVDSYSTSIVETKEDPDSIGDLGEAFVKASPISN